MRTPLDDRKHSRVYKNTPMTLPGLQSLKFATFSLMLTLMLGFTCEAAHSEDEIFGPPKPKFVKTPFTVSDKGDGDKAGALDAITVTNEPLVRRSLSSRMVQSRLYLPERMVLGRVAEFTIKGKPGRWVALAMADKDSGSKPVLGHDVKLGADRKVIATTKIPESGIATILIDCPVEGDLVGAFLYFEAAVWDDERMKDVEIAQCVSTESKGPGFNGVLIEPQFEVKKGVKIIPTTVGPFMKNGQTAGLSSPQP